MIRSRTPCIVSALLLACQSASPAPAPPSVSYADMRSVAEPAFKLVAGTYSVEGKNPNGTAYRGVCLIEARPDGRYEFSWRVGAFHRGIGTVNGNMVTVEFGDTTPVVYELRWDGSLSGTWANGQASEELRPVGQLRASLLAAAAWHWLGTRAPESLRGYVPARN